MKKLTVLLFLFALAGQLAHAQFRLCPNCAPFTSSPASPSPVANELEVFQFSVPTLYPDESTRIYKNYEVFPFQVTTAAAGETMDAGIYVVNSAGTSATLYLDSAPISLATTAVPVNGYHSLYIPCSLGPGNFLCSNTGFPGWAEFHCPYAPSSCIFQSDWAEGASFNLTGKFAFAMCSTGTTAQVMPWISETTPEPWPNVVAPTAYVNTFGSAWVQTEWGTSNAPNFIPPEIFKSPWASDSNWGTDATDVCVNGSLPSTITLSNITPN